MAGALGDRKSVHYVRDVTFGEDAHQMPAGNDPYALAALRNTLMNGGVSNGTKPPKPWSWLYQRHGQAGSKTRLAATNKSAAPARNHVNRLATTGRPNVGLTTASGTRIGRYSIAKNSGAHWAVFTAIKNGAEQKSKRRHQVPSRVTPNESRAAQQPTNSGPLTTVGNPAKSAPTKAAGRGYGIMRALAGCRYGSRPFHRSRAAAMLQKMSPSDPLLPSG